MGMKLRVATSLASVLVIGLLLPLPASAQGFWGSSGTESFRWRGRVYGIDDIMIRGNQVRIEHVSALPIQNQNHRFSAPLPAAEVDLHLEVIHGRGYVRILEQPTSRNNYTAVVRVDDQDKNGDDDYEFELTWSRKNSGSSWDSDAYESAFRWRGRVDIGCEIEIRGREHRVKDEGGQGTREKSANFTAALPLADAPVSLKKHDGRGRVELVQTPSRGNNFTAVVRIEDSKNGADDYDFELRWPRQ